MTKFIEDCNTCIIKNKEIIFPEYLQVQDGNVIVVLYSEYKILIFSQKSLEEYGKSLENTISGTDIHSRNFMRMILSRAEESEIIDSKLKVNDLHGRLPDGKMKISYQTGRLELTRI